MLKQIKTEVCRAYNESTRQLTFKASGQVSVKNAVAIMELAAPEYNDFKASLLGKLPKGSLVTLAREGSVCVYVTIPQYANLRSLMNRVKADECTRESDGSIRLWWD